MSLEVGSTLHASIRFAAFAFTTKLSPEQQRYVGLQKESGNGLLTVLNDILDFSKLEAGEIQVEARRVELPALFESCAALFRAQAVEKALDLSLALDQTVPRWVKLDGHRLR